MAAASNKRKRSKRRRARGESDLVRLGAVCVVVIIAALALATLLRPDKGYARAEPLLAALAGGAGLGVVALLLIGLLRRVALVDVRDRGSLWQATTAWPGMAIVVTLFVADAAGPHLVGAIGALSRDGGASRAGEQMDFRRWQATVVPIIVGYMSAVRRDPVIVRGLAAPPRSEPSRFAERLGANARRSPWRSREKAAQLHARPELRRLTTLLERGLAFGERAQRSFLLAVKRVKQRGRTTRGRHSAQTASRGQHSGATALPSRGGRVRARGEQT